MKIMVLPPDVNESEADFTPVGTDIRFGFTAVRNAGANVVDQIVQSRREQGRFTDFGDFMNKVPGQVCNKRLIDSLIKAGAFDSLGHGRRALVAIAESAVDQYNDIKRNEAIGQDSLFADLDDTDAAGFGVNIVVPTIDEWDKQTLLAHERDMLGLYVSDHPLNGMEHVLARSADHTIGSLFDEGLVDRMNVTICGLVTSINRRLTKKGDAWASVTLEDLHGSIEVNFFPGTYSLLSTMLIEDTLLIVDGNLDLSKEQPSVRGRSVTAPDVTQGSTGPLVITLPATRCTPPVVDQLKDVLRTHPGSTEVRLKLQARAQTTLLRLGDDLRVEPSSALSADLKQLLGPGCLG
jgi:DNA polymerase-3 subunit alpha